MIDIDFALERPYSHRLDEIKEFTENLGEEERQEIWETCKEDKKEATTVLAKMYIASIGEFSWIDQIMKNKDD